ncbi:MAG: MoaD/ThiS family protein [Gammaproteobacteria bacterium]
MAVTVKYFASLRETLGRNEETIEFEDGMRLSRLWKKANDGEPMPESLMTAVNMEYVKGDVELADGDEVAFFPAVTGG